MTMTNGGDQTAQLTVLGTGRLPQPEGGPSVSLLEVFPNRFPPFPLALSPALQAPGRMAPRHSSRRDIEVLRQRPLLP